MRRLLSAIILSLAALFSTSVAMADSAGTVFMFVRDGSRDLDLMLREEVGVMTRMLEEAGYRVDIATASGEAMVAGSTTLTPTVTLDKVDLSSYAGVVLPCMAPARGFEVPDEVTALTRQAVELGLPIAASRGSVETLAQAAGGLVDRRYAFASAVDVSERPAFAGGDFPGHRRRSATATSRTAGICPLAARSLGEADGTVDLMTREFYCVAWRAAADRTRMKLPMESSLMAQGVELMLVGMGTVFVFLTSTGGSQHDRDERAGRYRVRNGTRRPPFSFRRQTPRTRRLAAIGAAISRHRQRK